MTHTQQDVSMSTEGGKPHLLPLPNGSSGAGSSNFNPAQFQMMVGGDTPQALQSTLQMQQLHASMYAGGQLGMVMERATISYQPGPYGGGPYAGIPPTPR